MITLPRTPSARIAPSLPVGIVSRPRRAVVAFAAAAAFVMLAPTAPRATAAEAGGSIAGSWSGGGWASFASGSKERARCRVRYTAHSSTSYAVAGTCATESGRVSQTATLHKTGANSYSGSFRNAEFDVSGTISVIVHGTSQTVTLRSGSGSAVLTLSR